MATRALQVEMVSLCADLDFGCDCLPISLIDNAG